MFIPSNGTREHPSVARMNAALFMSYRTETRQSVPGSSQEESWSRLIHSFSAPVPEIVLPGWLSFVPDGMDDGNLSGQLGPSTALGAGGVAGLYQDPSS